MDSENEASDFGMLVILKSLTSYKQCSAKRIYFKLKVVLLTWFQMIGGFLFLHELIYVLRVEGKTLI
jgi:hypothetical protein